MKFLMAQSREMGGSPRNAALLEGLLLFLFFLLPIDLPAAEFAPVFTDNAVLQRDEPVAVWGTGREGETVTIELFGHQSTAIVSNGRWRVELTAMQAAENGTLRLKGDNEVELKNIAVGEVWMASGQSNMEWRLEQCAPLYDVLIQSANESGIRELKIPLRAYSGDPLPQMAWNEFVQGSAAKFGGVSYFFASGLRRELGVVVGIINCSYGGTPIEAWMDRETIRSTIGNKLLEEDAEKMAQFSSPLEYEKAWLEYLEAIKARASRKKAGLPAAEVGPLPRKPYGYRTESRPGCLNESMLGVIRPYTARGFLWYQGENNHGNLEYKKMLEGFLFGIRKEWNKPLWPFLIAQLSSNSAKLPDDGESFAIIRQAQLQVAMETPGSGLVVTLDQGEQGNVHPRFKKIVGERLARLAMGRVYGRPEPKPQSPVAFSATRQNGGILVCFHDVPKHLEIRGGSPPVVEVQNELGDWLPAACEPASDSNSILVVPPKEIKEVQAVRYAWRNFCSLSIYSDEGLPVSPWNLAVGGQEGMIPSGAGEDRDLKK